MRKYTTQSGKSHTETYTMIVNKERREQNGGREAELKRICHGGSMEQPLRVMRQ